MHCGELRLKGNDGSLGISCSTRSIAKHVAGLRGRLLQNDIRILVTYSYDVLEGEECESEFSALDFHLIIYGVEANEVLNAVELSLSFLFQDNLEESFLKADGGQLSLIQYEGDAIRTQTLKKGYDGYRGSHASEICDRPLLPIFRDDAQEAEAVFTKNLFGTETHIVESYKQVKLRRYL